MTTWKLILRNLRYYRLKNLPVILGISISAAVLTGALIVGDSVSHNLNRIVDLRLGNVNYTLTTGERFVTSHLAKDIEVELDALITPVLVSEGMAVSGGGEFRANNIQVLGITHSFDDVMGIQPFYAGLAEDEVIISHNLAERLKLNEGDEFLLRIRKASLIPLNAPFVSDEDLIVSARLRVKAIAEDDQTGRFNLRISQTSPYNAFVSLELLNQLMELENKSNLLLFSSKSSLEKEIIYKAIRQNWSIEDAGLLLRELPEFNEYEIISERVFLDSPVNNALNALQIPSEFILTYFVNSISKKRSGESTLSSSLFVPPITPYSFVSTLPGSYLSEKEIIVNAWLANDLQIIAGDTIILKYYTVGPLRSLAESEESFVVKDVVPMEGRYKDVTLMPEIPGLSDAGNCRDWDTGIPIDLSMIRDKDEKYWEDYKGTPKAFISLPLAKDLWENMYGSYTAFRISSHHIHRDSIINHIRTNIDPVSLGFQVSAVKEDSYKAAGQGVDFSQLFLGLSFFVLLSAIILTVLLLILNFEGRRKQIETLSALGIPRKTINKIMFAEGLFLSGIGSLAGTGLALLYTGLVFSALNGVWADIVRTDMMQMHVSLPVLFIGFLVSTLISYFTLFLTIRNFLKTKQKREQPARQKISKRIRLYVALLSGIISILLVFSQIIRSEIINSGVFFIAGGLMLVSLLLWFYHLMIKAGNRHFSTMNTLSLAVRNSIRNKNRSLSIVSLLGIATFIVLSTGANRKDLFADSADRTSGTGGFLFFSEATVAITRDLNKPDVREEFGLAEESHFVQFSRAPGDDASCLNLNRISNPVILGVKPAELEGRFSFVSRTPYLSIDNPWSSLKNPLPGGLIPAIADETVIKWGLGMKVGDTLDYYDGSGRQVNLLLIGGLANSVFQGNVIIADEYFQKHFPDHIGSGVFLIDAENENQQEIETELNFMFRDYGWEMILTAERLALFNSVENTYLSIFLLMGALSLLIGTIGLSIVLARSILERKNEIAILKALGISSRKILGLIMNEYLLLLLAGISAGVITSTMAVLPALLSPHTGISLSSFIIITSVLFLNGVFWIWIMAKAYLGDQSIGLALKNE